ncbi:hypothetical protein D3C76_1725990 [compost metagenome]
MMCGALMKLKVRVGIHSAEAADHFRDMMYPERMQKPERDFSLSGVQQIVNLTPRVPVLLQNDLSMTQKNTAIPVKADRTPLPFKQRNPQLRLKPGDGAA